MHPPMDSDSLDTALERAADIVRSAERVAVLTGAGVSAESGVPTFRGAGGLWEGYRIDEVASPFAFQRDPTLVWRFYNMRWADLRDIRPNPGHQALVALEEKFGPERFTLITQNVDGLHRAAGSRHVLELHGNLSRCAVPAVGGSRTEAARHSPACRAASAALCCGPTSSGSTKCCRRMSGKRLSRRRAPVNVFWWPARARLCILPPD